MEIYNDPPKKRHSEVLKQTSSARTPLLDVQNFTNLRFDPQSTPKRQQDGHSRRPKHRGSAPSFISSLESNPKTSSGLTEPVLHNKLCNIEEIDVGAEIVLPSADGLKDSSPLLPLEPKDCKEMQCVENLCETSAGLDNLREASRHVFSHGDHAYLALERTLEAQESQSFGGSHMTDKCVGTEESLVPSSTIYQESQSFGGSRMTDKCVGTEECLVPSSTIYQESQGFGGSHMTDKCVGTEEFSVLSSTTNYVNVSTETEDTVTTDCGVLAVPDCLSQETMTVVEAADASSSMTPFKLGKHGTRLTAEEVRRQHPRVVANQIETVMLSNQRLEKEVKASEREKNLLKSSLRNIKLTMGEHEATISNLEASLEDSQQKLDHQEKLVLEERMKCWNAEETLQNSTSELQKKCYDLETMRLEAEQNFAEELKRIQTEAEENSYRKQFESAQQKIRELQAVENEYTQLMDEIGKSFELQEHLQRTVSVLQASANGLAMTNKQLNNENESLKKSCLSKEVDLDVVRYLNQELLSDNEKMKGLLTQSNERISELETTLNAANDEIISLQNQLAERAAENVALAAAMEELRRSKAMMVIQLSEQQDSETVALQALEEAEDQLRITEEELVKEKGILAAEKEMHERMTADFEEKNLKLEMEIQHLEKLLDKSELKREAQEQELYECQEQLYTLQEIKAAFEETTMDVDSSVSALHTVQEQMEALLATLNRKVKSCGSKFPFPGVRSSTPKKKKKEDRRSFVAQVLSTLSHGQASDRNISDSTPHKNSHALSMDTRNFSSPHEISGHRQHRQQSNVEFGAPCAEFGEAAAALLSPHSQSFCGVPSSSQASGILGSHRKSVSFCEGSRRELFVDSITDDRLVLSKGNEMVAASEMSDRVVEDSHSATPGFAKIKSIPLIADITSKNAELELGDGSGNSESAIGKSLPFDSSSLSEKVMILAQLFRQIMKTIQLVERAAQLTLKDVQDELHFVKDQLKHENRDKQDVQSELEKKTDSLNLLNSRHKELQSRVSDMTKSLLNFHDQSLQISVMILAQLFRQIMKTIQLVERAAQLTLKDVQDELHFVKDQLKHENRDKQDVQSELEKKTDSLNLLNSRHKELQSRVSDMTKSLLNFHDQSLQISRLEEEKRDMKWKITDLEGQCSLLSDHLEAVVKKLDLAMAGQAAYDGVSAQEVLALKKEKHELMVKLFEERDQHRDLGDKAVKRMKILESNWKKAENEVKRLDELVEEVREGCVTSRAQSTHPLILNIVRLIDGKIASLKSNCVG
ncbi:hypothetical protein PoB_003544500 [Plakobranchus ocellatus]|uniref:Uncharacterized protein n=1 Tax=Plakobranchus ocellatus TaxID=259542 RepID=A0AAV4APY9_9GAST|nr:hypothetical protein PoB_003544500 [Plakobranchus ocellatus]